MTSDDPRSEDEQDPNASAGPTPDGPSSEPQPAEPAATEEGGSNDSEDPQLEPGELSDVVGGSMAAHFMPGLDMSKLLGFELPNVLPKFDFSSLVGVRLPDVMPKLDIPSALPDLDWPNILGPQLPDILPKLDFSHLVGFAIADYWADILEGSGLAELIESFKRQLPPNWPSDVDFDAIEAILNEDGLPLVWVPRSEIIELLMTAESRTARTAILLAHTNDVLQDCRGALSDVSHEKLAGQLPLARAALEAYASGHQESAQALSVLVTETALSHTFALSYRKLQAAAHVDFEEVDVSMTRLMGALAPIGRFYTEWWPKDGTPALAELSRHVSVHNADSSHYTEENALIAVMLMTSILRQLNDFHTEQESDQEDA